MRGTLAILVLLALAAPPAGAADPAPAPPSIEGLWLAEKEDAGIRVEPCGAELCASLVAHSS